ncbi:MAG: LCP family protein [Actinomycetota bacterium]|nr:LCP family protein [Actinomycetota bacterium]
MLVSALVLGLTGVGWSTFQDLQHRLTTVDVTGGFTAPDGATDLLLVGSDSRTDAQGNPLPAEVLSQLRASDNEGGDLTDTVILVRIPNDGRRAVAVSLPRDLYVELPDGYGQHKLNSAFARAKNETATRLVKQGADPARVHSESIAAGRRMLVKTVEDLTGAGVDHYAELNLLGFARLTEAVGGVEVCLRAPVDDQFSGAHFPAGAQTISGADALAFVRQRHGLPHGDLDRVVRQQAFLAGLTDKVLSAGTLANPGRIRELLDATQQALVLDRELNVLDFASRMRGVAAGDVEFVTVPVLGEASSDGDGSVLEVDPKAVRRFVADVISRAPVSGHAPAAGRGSPAVAVDVFNGSGANGLASRVSGELGNQGFRSGAIGNTDPRATSVVRSAPSERNAGDAVAGALGGLPVEEDETVAPGSVQVYLGADYSGPDTVNLTSAPPLPVGVAAPRQAPPAAAPITAGDVPCVD